MFFSGWGWGCGGNSLQHQSLFINIYQSLGQILVNYSFSMDYLFENKSFAHCRTILMTVPSRKEDQLSRILWILKTSFKLQEVIFTWPEILFLHLPYQHERFVIRPILSVRCLNCVKHCVEMKDSVGWRLQLSVVHDVVVMVIHENGHRLTDDDRYPHRHIPILAMEELLHEYCQWKLQTQKTSMWRICYTIPVRLMDIN